jgi:hypothetical protein
MDSQETWLEVFLELSNQFTLGAVAHLKLVLNFDVPNLFTIHTSQLDDGLEFSFTDKRRFARVRLFDDVGASQVLVNYVEILPPINTVQVSSLSSIVRSLKLYPQFLS